MPRRQAENTEKKNQKERRVMSQKERVDLIEVDLLDMCKYIPVSYTHLDVYKRQGLRRSIREKDRMYLFSQSAYQQ